ncbi:Protein of unknown function [Lactobacillus acidophilus DSM 9126]|nr:Protein of unknown function [Lactobacillus acidophilus DSM 20079 = JCM 1132 = NBRC 13951 = CIP 76.13]CDF70201.1 Protein of unknown function [Lactobacillus acidophilus CIRM-BIA 442]CDF71995.1 Protein of unknown function [Lactobacillus acidophilus CIRM-BIA 445]CDF73817.1 Protein of unknown function [Lactobacillus acidophilus DSM 9126]CDF75821.1 Protein of unknown function [Lactobacillus acidophilus DSM 20242]
MGLTNSDRNSDDCVVS